MTDSVETITTAAEEAAAHIQIHEEKLREVQNFRDEDLTPEANERKRAELVDAVKAESQQTLEDIRSKATKAAESAAKSFQGKRPQINDTDAAALLRAEQVWRYDVLPSLEAGTTLKAFVRNATPDQLLSIERFAPGYLAAQQVRNGEGPGNPLELEPNELQAAVYNSLATALPADAQSDFESGVRAAHAAEVFATVDSLASDALAGKHWNPTSAYAQARSAAIRLRG